MSKEVIVEQFIVTIKCDRVIPNLADHVAGRMWSLNGVIPHGVDAKPYKLTAAVAPAPEGTPIPEDFVFTSSDALVEQAVATFKPMAQAEVDALGLASDTEQHETVTLRVDNMTAMLINGLDEKQIVAIIRDGIAGAEPNGL